jgi:hypothetical protein
MMPCHPLSAIAPLPPDDPPEDAEPPDDEDAPDEEVPPEEPDTDWLSGDEVLLPAHAAMTT